MALQNQYQQVVIRFQICIFDILNTVWVQIAFNTKAL